MAIFSVEAQTDGATAFKVNGARALHMHDEGSDWIINV